MKISEAYVRAYMRAIPEQYDVTPGGSHRDMIEAQAYALTIALAAYHARRRWWQFWRIV